jgi:hypothetical protein
MDAGLDKEDLGKPCAEDGCDDFVPPGAHNRQIYCEFHKVPKNRKRVPRGDKAPINVTFGAAKTTGKSAEAQRAQRVAKGASSMIKMAGAGFALAGDTTCAAAFVNGSESFGQAMADLSKYQPWIATIFAPAGEATGQASAWFAAALATAGIAIPVMSHHGMISDNIANKFAGVMTEVAVQSKAAAETEPANADVAA